MRRIAFTLAWVATLAGVVAFTAPASNQEGAPIFVTGAVLPSESIRLSPAAIGLPLDVMSRT
jgi:hypothetical protein